MNLSVSYIKYGALFLLLAVVGSCDLEDERDVCRDNVELSFRYCRSDNQDLLSQQVRTLRVFLFDKDSVFLKSYDVSGPDLCRQRFRLPAGCYTLVAWGNLDKASETTEAVTGQTQLSVLQLSVNSPCAGGRQNNCENLFYGSCAFVVEETGRTTCVTDLSCAYNYLAVTVRWKSETPDLNAGRYAMRLHQAVGGYAFAVADRIVVSGAGPARDARMAGSPVIHAIPALCPEKTVNHEITAQTAGSRELYGSFVTYRYTNEQVPAFQLFRDEIPVMKEIDLGLFFRSMGWELSRNIRQTFHIQVEIDGDKVIVSSAYVGDWEDGGSISNEL